MDILESSMRDFNLSEALEGASVCTLHGKLVINLKYLNSGTNYCLSGDIVDDGDARSNTWTEDGIFYIGSETDINDLMLYTDAAAEEVLPMDDFSLVISTYRVNDILVSERLDRKGDMMIFKDGNSIEICHEEAEQVIRAMEVFISRK